jgi:hypothetical protein
MRKQSRKVIMVNGKKIKKWLLMGLKPEGTLLKHFNLLFFISFLEQIDKYIASQLFKKLKNK